MRLTQLIKCLALKLAHPLSAQTQDIRDFLQCMRMIELQPIAPAYNLLVSGKF